MRYRLGLLAALVDVRQCGRINSDEVRPVAPSEYGGHRMWRHEEDETHNAKCQFKVTFDDETRETLPKIELKSFLWEKEEFRECLTQQSAKKNIELDALLYKKQPWISTHHTNLSDHFVHQFSVLIVIGVLGVILLLCFYLAYFFKSDSMRDL